MIGPTTGLEKEVNYSGTVTQYSLAINGADDNTYAPGADSTKFIAGVFQFAPNTDQPQVRLRMSGISWVMIGAGGITRGQPVTSDGSGNGVYANPAAGTNAYIVGWAMASGVQGQLVPVLIVPQRIQG
jgi:hypothetical protein